MLYDTNVENVVMFSHNIHTHRFRLHTYVMCLHTYFENRKLLE